MQLTGIKGINFKNYEQFELQFLSSINCFVGQNGMGKTNLLDAIYYLCVGKSYFSGSDRNLVRQGEDSMDFFRLEGDFEKSEKPARIVIKVQPNKRKEIEYNKVKYKRLSEHLGVFPVVVIAPFDVALALEGSEVRRNFLDNMLAQLDTTYLQQLIQYNKLLDQRNTALKQFAETRRFDKTLLDIYNQQLIPLGNFIHQRRKAFLAQFKPQFTNFYQVISGGKETVHYEYISKLNEQDFATLLENALEKDRILQRSTVGIHKDDIAFFINEFPLKKFASQGQLKSFVLGLKLAQYQVTKEQKGFAPLLLLDDIFDRLDRSRVKQLIDLLIEQSFGQIFITDTDEERIQQIFQEASVSFQTFKIQDGSVLDEFE